MDGWIDEYDSEPIRKHPICILFLRPFDVEEVVDHEQICWPAGRSEREGTTGAKRPLRLYTGERRREFLFVY